VKIFPAIFARPKRRIFCDPSSSSAARAFRLESQKLISDPHEAEILWMRKGYTKRYPALQPGQLINHFPNESAIINKGLLTETLKRYDSSLPGDGSDISEF
jgi:hypothetical protein